MNKKGLLLFLFLFSLFLFIPSDTFAKSVSYQDGSMFYATTYSSSNDTTGSILNYYQSYSSIPWYPYPTQKAPYAMYHNALEFILINNTGTLTGRSYTATVVFTYKFDGIYSRLLSNPGDFTGSIIAVGSNVLSSSNTISITPTNQQNGATVTISSTVNLNSSTNIDKFTIALSGGSDNSIALCDPLIYSDYYGKNLTCGSSTGNITTQVSLVDFNITVSQDINTGLLNNINQNQQITNEKLDDTNKKLDEAENTRKGIWESIKELPSKFMDMLKSLFIPEDDYFEKKFDELTDNITGVLGFLAYPFTLITNTFEFFMTVEDTGSYIIKWPDIPVPNFEDHNIIEAGEYDLGQLLTNDKIAGLRNIAFVFIKALLLLAFLQLCKNQYNRVFGGDVSETEFISVAEEYDIDYKTGEVSNIKHIEKKTTRRDIN